MPGEDEHPAHAPVAICLLKRFVADVDLQSDEPFLPECAAATGKRVAIVGAGPAGLAAAYYLLQGGHACVLFDEHDQPGGMLRYGVGEEELPREVLNAEIGIIRRLGAEFRLNERIEPAGFGALREDFDAVLVAAGEMKPGEVERFGLAASECGVRIDRNTFAASQDGVFAGGGSVRPSRMAVRAVAEGRSAAVAMHQYLSGEPVTGENSPWSVHIGKLQEGEMARFMAEADDSPRVEQQDDFSKDQACIEARRCLHCDCRSADDCGLRLYAERYGAKAVPAGGERTPFEQQRHHPEVVYEPGKCIRCGLCVQITRAAGEKMGLSFVGRGFKVRVAGALNGSIADALKESAAECVAACPTGALAWK